MFTGLNGLQGTGDSRFVFVIVHFFIVHAAAKLSVILVLDKYEPRGGQYICVLCVWLHRIYKEISQYIPTFGFFQCEIRFVPTFQLSVYHLISLLDIT